MNGKPIVNVRTVIAGFAVVACALPGLSVAQNSNYDYRSGPPAYSPSNTYSYRESESNGGPDYPPNRDGYGTTSNPHYAQPGDPNYVDQRNREYRDHAAADAHYHGTVQAVEIVRDEGHRSGAGAVIGGLAGGALGNQVGHGAGNAAATIGGVIGGAYLGNELEKRRERGETQRISVRMDDGTVQAFMQDAPELRAGDRVRVARDGRLELA